MFDMANQDDLLRGSDLGRSGEQHAERSLCSGAGKGPCRAEGGPLSVRRRSAPSGDCNVDGSGSAADPHVRTLRGMFHIRRGPCPCGHEYGGRVWDVYAGGNIQSFRKRGKRIPGSRWDTPVSAPCPPTGRLREAALFLWPRKIRTCRGRKRHGVMCGSRESP